MIGYKTLARGEVNLNQVCLEILIIRNDKHNKNINFIFFFYLRH